MRVPRVASTGGRPRLDSDPDFIRRFAGVLPALRRREISQGQAAAELGISVRSLKRYEQRAEEHWNLRAKVVESSD